jgi:hypothetical protein
VREVNRPSDATYQLGWVTTSPDMSWNGSAVFESPDGGSTPLTYPQGHLYEGQGLDLAFVITGAEPPSKELDFGDAPAPYPTTLADDGARHTIVPGIYLGNGVDDELDGQPEWIAEGDDHDGNDDEDGVNFISLLKPGQMATIHVTANVAGLLDAWIDFNDDGSWAEFNDQIFNAQPLAAGLNSLTFQVPSSATWGIRTFARFRFSTVGGLPPTGQASDGEVEDHSARIEPMPEYK